MNNSNGKFNWNINDVRFQASNGEYVKSEDLKQFFGKRKTDMLTITENLNIGDVVQLKMTKEIVTISELNFSGVKYAGYVQGETALTLFGQEDIEKVISYSNAPENAIKTK